MNRNQIITLVIGTLLAIFAPMLHVGVPDADIQNGIAGIVIVVYSLLAHDANGDSLFGSKSSVTGMVGGAFWLITSLFHVDISEGVKTSIMGIILSLQGYYTLNHSSIVHEIKGTVGEQTK